jgi:putative flippase GtrA
MRDRVHDQRLRRETATFLRFCVVGGGGFFADAGILLLCTSVLHLDPIYSRAISAPLAIAFTYVLNRIWAFSHAARKPVGKSLAAYFVVQAMGFACNFAVYTALLRLYDWMTPLAALAVGSAVGLAVNYAGARLLVFGGAGKT